MWITGINRILSTALIIIILQICGWAQNLQDIQLANQYYQDGEVDKAVSLYDKLAQNSKNIPQIHNNYYKVLLNNSRFTDAEKYIKQVIKHFPRNIYYKIDRGLIYVQKNEKEKEEKYYEKLIKNVANNQHNVRMAAQHFARNQLYQYALDTYLLARKKSGNENEYALQLANVYRMLNKKNKMIEEYLNFAEEKPNQLNSIKNILQKVLKEEEDLDSFKKMMIEKVQKNPNNSNYSDLLIWTLIQQKDFYAAFIQSRAIDKRKNIGGNGIIRIGKIALENDDYKNAIRMFNYVVDYYPQTRNYQIARRLSIQAREDKIKHTYPVEKTEISNLIQDYESLVKELGLNQYTVEALRSKALLHAMYLDEHEKAINILKEIINYPRMKKSIVDKSKLDLGDIYLLTDKPWESTLLYSQVEKSSEETPIGYEAKLKNAKLFYYKGEFALAMEQLDVLKMATTREIANKAMKLSLLIKDNTALDTTDTKMQRYANIDLLMFQNKKLEALDSIHTLQADTKDHSLYDELLWLEANLYLELGEFQKTADALEIIVNNYDYDILGDDAMHLLGEVYEQYLDDEQKAMEIYHEFLKAYPGSIYIVDARKSLRTLRGDFIN